MRRRPVTAIDAEPAAPAEQSVSAAVRGIRDLWRDLGRDYVDEEHDGNMREALIEVLLFAFAAVILVAGAVGIAAVTP